MADATRRGEMRISSDPDTTRIEEPSTHGARERPSMPLRMLLVANLAPHAQAELSEGAILESVDKQSFAAFMQRVAPRLSLDVPNRMGKRPRKWEVELTFSELDDFRPERLAGQMPALARLVDVRGLVEQVRDHEIDPAALRTRLEEIGVEEERAEELYAAFAPTKPEKASKPSSRPSRPKQKPAADDPLDRLFGMVDAGDGSHEEREPSSPGLVDALVGAAAGTAASRPKSQSAAAARLLEDVDRTISRQLNALLDHPELRQLEAAWRGLKLLVDRIDFRQQIDLEVLPARKSAIDDALYHHVLLPEHEGTDKAPLSVIILDAAFSNRREDIALLSELASTAASLQVPIIGAAAPAFFGLEQEAGLERLPLVGQHLDGPEYIEWRKLRELDAAQHLVLTVPRFLLRYPYGTDAPADGLVFEEEGALWGNASLLAAVVVADSFAHTGSPSHVRGRAVEDLPLWKQGQRPAPLAAVFSTGKQRELASAGFAVFSARNDAASLVHAPSIKRTPALENAMATREARLHAALPCQLFVARAAHFLLQLQGEVEPGTSVEEARAQLADRFRTWMHASDAPEAVEVEHVAEAEIEGHELLAVRLQPPSDVLEDTVRLVLACQVPKAVGGGTDSPTADETQASGD